MGHVATFEILVHLTWNDPNESSQKFLNYIKTMIKTMFLEILNVDAHNQIVPIKCVTDSKLLYDAVYSTKILTIKDIIICNSRVVRKTRNPFCDVGL